MPYPSSDVPRVRTFHGRAGRLGPQSTRAMAELFPALGIPLADADAVACFPAGTPVVLEIGSGMGEATAEMAAADPATGIIAVEVHTAGVAALLRRIEDSGLPNVRVVHGDAVTVLERMIPVDSLAGIRLFFPDPWPKARHHKRRFVRPDLVRMAVRRLTPGGLFHAATDWQDYAQQMLEVFSGEPDLVNEYDGFAPRPAWRPMTRFERKGLRRGHAVRDLMFRRTG